MSFSTLLYISLSVIGLVFLALIVFLYIMFANKKKINKSMFPKCPDVIFSRYQVWYVSFTLWTTLEYFLLIIPLFTSVATIYFTSDILSEKTVDASAILLTIMSLISALMPLISSKILPKTHADGFYKGAVLLENGMLKYEQGLISTEDLIGILDKAERCTNPLAYMQDE